ncbi:MAG: hypothetical protein MI702_00350 [Chlorobiales bacterium]|nr:hypothetical protein [Chlorobiales bacterium]
MRPSNQRTIIKYSCLIALVVINLFPGCAPDEDRASSKSEPNEQARSQLSIPEELWNNDLQSFRQWQLVAGTSEKMKGKGWHSELATIRANVIANDSINDENSVLPDGSILAKENFDANNELVDIVTMKKIKGRWYWSQFSPEGIPEITGFDAGKCIQCHSMTPNDSVFSWKKNR